MLTSRSTRAAPNVLESCLTVTTGSGPGVTVPDDLPAAAPSAAARSVPVLGRVDSIVSLLRLHLRQRRGMRRASDTPELPVQRARIEVSPPLAGLGDVGLCDQLVLASVIAQHVCARSGEQPIHDINVGIAQADRRQADGRPLKAARPNLLHVLRVAIEANCEPSSTQHPGGFQARLHEWQARVKSRPKDVERRVAPRRLFSEVGKIGRDLRAGEVDGVENLAVAASRMTRVDELLPTLETSRDDSVTGRDHVDRSEMAAAQLVRLFTQ